MTEDRKLLESMATVVSAVLRILPGLVTAGLVADVVRGSRGSGSVCLTDDSAFTSATSDGFLPRAGPRPARSPATAPRVPTRPCAC